MIITLSTGKEYDTSNPDQHKKLLAYIPVLKSRRKNAELDGIKKQIEDAANISDTEVAIYKKADGTKDLKNNTNNKKLNPTLPKILSEQNPKTTADVKVAAPPLLIKTDVRIAVPLPLTKTDVKIIAPEPLPKSDEIITATLPLAKTDEKITTPIPHLPHPEDPINTHLIVNSKEAEEDGETSFQSLYAYLLADMSKYTGNINLLVTYSTLVVNLFVHAATYTPTKGQGKAQRREFDHKTQLQYFRSQGDHANAKLFRELIKGKCGNLKSRLPLNKGFVNLISPPDFPEKFCTEIKKIDLDTGLLKKEVKKVDPYVINKIAHAGARKNNFSTLAQGMNIVVGELIDEQASKALTTKLQQVLKPSHKIVELDKDALLRRIQDLLCRFKKMQPRPAHATFSSEKLSSELLGYRVNRVKSLQEKIKAKKFKHLAVDDSHQDITCLMIRLYPKCIRDDDSYKEGVTNVLLSFFGALINHHIKRRGLQLRAERRQSFGFLRPTLTDAGNLMIRLSLGLEPMIFDEIVLQSLEDLEKVLEKFKFDNPTHESVKSVFELKPAKTKKKTPKIKRKPDTYIRNVVRKDNKTLTTFQQAEAYLNQAALSNEVNYIEKAMENFLGEYIRNGKVLKIPEVVEKDKSPVQPCSSIIINLLKNLLDYTVRFIADLEFLAENDPLQAFAHSYWHSLLKLYNNTSEAQTLLDNIDKIEASEFYRRASLLAENMLEYLISLDALKQIRCELQGKPADPIAKLRNTEMSYFSQALAIPQSRVDLFFADSGQQAITTTLLVLSVMLHGPAADGKTYDQDIHLFGKSYFEVAAFLEDVKKEDGVHQMSALEKSKIVFADISQLQQLDINKCRAMMALVIDITHHPLADSELLKQTIATIHANGGWVVLVESALKHEELGLDKYQSGKITTLAPPNKSLPTAAKDQFSAVSKEAMPLSVASYFQMVNEISRDKLPAQEKDIRDTVSTKALTTAGIFKINQPTNSPTKATIIPEAHQATNSAPTQLS